MKQISLKLKRKNAAELVNFGREVRDKIILHADLFTDTPVSVLDFSADLQALETAQQATLKGGEPETALRDEKRRIVEKDLRLLGNYVENLAKGDVEIIYKAGMTPKAKGPRRYDFLATPQNLKAKQGLSGEVRLRWTKVPYAKSYMVEYCSDPVTPENWRNGTYNSSANATISGLEPMRRYWFRVRAIGSQSMMSEWSDPTMIDLI